jgi:hypothetical protein
LQFAEIKALNCECSFGMPSGHSATVTIGVLVALDCLLQIRKQSKKKIIQARQAKGDYKDEDSDSPLKNSTLEKVIAIILIFGVHSVSQIILGASMSWMIFEAMMSAKPTFKAKIKSLDNTSVKESTMSSYAWMIYIIASVLSFLLILIFNSSKVPSPAEYQTNYSKCEPKCTNYYS